MKLSLLNRAALLGLIFVMASSFATAQQGDPCQCDLLIRAQDVSPGDVLVAEIDLWHRKRSTVETHFIVQIREMDETVLFERTSPMIEIHYLDRIRRRYLLNLPENIEIGTYVLAFGMDGMSQGYMEVSALFTVTQATPRQAPLTYGSMFDSVILPEVLIGPWRAVAEEGALPSTPELTENYPNPFNPSSEISYALTESGHVRLAVYDVLGRQVSVLVDGTMNAGTHAVAFDGSGLPSGTYFYRLETAQGSLVRTMLLAK